MSAPAPLLTRLLFLRAQRPGGDDGFQRLMRGFVRARSLLALSLLLALWVGTPPSATLQPNLLLAAAHALLTLLPVVWPALLRGVQRGTLGTLRGLRWWSGVALDILVFALLQALDPGSPLPFAALYILPVLMSGVMASRRLALAVAAWATLASLGASLWAGLAGPDLLVRLSAAGLAGLGYFVVALLAVELAERLAGEQRAAQGSQADARQQAALNQLVIDELREGVLVVDREGQVRAANPAARALLADPGLAPAAPFSLNAVAHWRPLWQALEPGFVPNTQPPARADVLMALPSGLTRRLRMRARYVPARGETSLPELCLLLLENHATLVARARQEKLAAMGRMSAGIAHEIRNPLSAIAQANELLREDLPRNDSGGQRLTGLVASNVKRLQRIVDEVAVLATPSSGEATPLAVQALIEEVCEDWTRTQPGLGDDGLRRSIDADPAPVLFDAEHLRRVLVNLLDNAWRHCGEGGWLRVELEAPIGLERRLVVLNPGAPLPAEVERHLFEPFYSTRARGSGLGLTICRELCERYGARIDYQARTLDGQPMVAFIVSLRLAVAQAE